MPRYRGSLCFVPLLLLLCCHVASAQSECYTPGSVAGIVVATVVVTIVAGGLVAAFLWYLWKQRKGNARDKSCPEKQLIARDDYAFDNPYFKDDAEKGEAGIHVDNGSVKPLQNAKASPNGTAQKATTKKARPFSNISFHSVFTGSSSKKTTLDDASITQFKERKIIPLKGRDFTGLGFNICGNMKEGIFVKEVLHRGPASGSLSPGDKILGVRVSFGAMVYEDALTILSYASPYEVQLEVESSAPHKKQGTSTQGKGLFHPLYRSQSSDDLAHILPQGSKRDATPKRSHSVGVEASSNKSKYVPPPTPPTLELKESPKLESTFQVEQEIPEIVEMPHIKEEKQDIFINVTDRTVAVEQDSPYQGVDELDKPTAPPRKNGSTPAKRRAPAPPKTETAVLIHRAEEPAKEGTLEDSRRKASSLGDLTKLDEDSSSTLERAVSLDLQQSMPGENLARHKVHGTPTLEEEEHQPEPSLKRWDLSEGLDKVLGELTNGNEEKETEEKPKVELSKPVNITIPIIKPDMRNLERLDAGKRSLSKQLNGCDASGTKSTSAIGFARSMLTPETSEDILGLDAEPTQNENEALKP